MIDKKKVFLASSSELKADREQFEIAIGRKNKDWVDKGVFIELVVWEDFLDAMSKTRLQDEYNQAIRGCDLFVMLFWTKVGKYTEEEFETAVGQFQATHKPFVFTYFKDAPISSADLNDGVLSLLEFKKKLQSLGHFYSTYKTVDELNLKFYGQLDKLIREGFIQFQPEREGPGASAGAHYQASVIGSGAVAQGAGAKAVGAGGVLVDGDNHGDINTGVKIDWRKPG